MGKIGKQTSDIKKHFVKKWEVSIMELKSGNNKKFKVTRRIPELSISETKIFTGKEKAKRQFYEWLK